MAISRIPQRMQSLAEAVLALSETARAIRSQSGDLSFVILDQLQDRLAGAKSAAYAAIAEIGDGTGGKAEAAAAEMARHGFNGTLIDLQTNLAAIEAAALAWNDALDAALRAMTDAVFLVSIEDSRFRRAAQHIPAATADTLRPNLDGIISGLDAVGA